MIVRAHLNLYSYEDFNNKGYRYKEMDLTFLPFYLFTLTR